MNQPDSVHPARTKRRRQSPQRARRAILDAAGNRLTRDGPDGLRLQAIAADLGITHSSILHHFGSRERLLEALAHDAFEALDRDLRAGLEAERSAEDGATTDLFERVARTLRDQGHARLLAWRILSGRLPGSSDEPQESPPDEMLSRIADVVHRVRLESIPESGFDPPELEDTRFFVLLIAYSLFAEALAGDLLAISTGLEASDEVRQRFRHWWADRSQLLIAPTPASRTEED